jgi:hypothetical protein
MQSKKGSVVESVTNIVIGFGINWAVNMIGFRAFGFDVSGESVLAMSVVMTFISFGRSYLVRRAFNSVEALR